MSGLNQPLNTGLETKNIINNASVTMPQMTYKIPPVADLTVLSALPPAAQLRETKKAADTFASTGRNIFVHYITPVLEKRRALLLAARRKDEEEISKDRCTPVAESGSR